MIGKLVELGENVWVWPHDPEPNVVQSAVGVIVDRGETVLVEMLAELAREDYDLYVEGHDRPFTREELREFLAGK